MTRGAKKQNATVIALKSMVKLCGEDTNYVDLNPTEQKCVYETYIRFSLNKVSGLPESSGSSKRSK